MIFKRQKGAKYKNTKVVFDGEKFDSKKEMNRYIFLLNAQKEGLITNLTRQVKFELIPSIKKQEVIKLKTKDKVVERVVQLAITYTCDFMYYKDGEQVVEDVKPSLSFLPKEFVIKEKIFRWKYGFPIKKVVSPNEPI